MKIASLFSGGKDSAYALFCAMQQGYDVRALVTLYPQPDSMMFHYPNVDLTQLQAEAIGIPHVIKKTEKGEEAELAALTDVLRGLKVDAVVSGAVESEYQKQRIDLICDELGIMSFAPLWRKRPVPLLHEMLGAGLEIIVTAASAEGLGKEWLGRKLDAKAVDELAVLQKTKGVHPIFEGGEGETLVTWAPFFRKRLVLEKAEKKWSGSSGMLHITKAHLA